MIFDLCTDIHQSGRSVKRLALCLASRRLGALYLALMVACCCVPHVFAQSVCLPAPRLLTTFPMGGQVGTTVEVSITADNAENLEELSFSHPGLTSAPVLDDNGLPIANKYLVTIAED
ncbi:MAG: hypothetical protein WBH28_02725, partial [Fuerstiella sp.]